MSTDVFRAIADPRRRQLIDLLSREGPQSLRQLTAQVPVSRQAVSKHLALLEEAGIVHGTTQGRERLLRLTPQPLAEIHEWAKTYIDFWSRNLDALEAHIDADESDGHCDATS